MLPLLLALQAAASPPNDALRYDITLVPADTGTHLLGEVETAWRLASPDPVAVQLDSSMRVVRVLIDGRPNTRLSRTMYGRSADDLVVPHQKGAGDSISTRIRYHGLVRDGATLGATASGERSFVAVGSGARSWLPVPLETRFDRVTASFRIQTKGSQRAIAPGVLEKVDTLPYDHLVWRYRMDSPAPIAALAAASGTYRVRDYSPRPCTDRCSLVEMWTVGESPGLNGAWLMVSFFARRVGAFPYPRLIHAEAAVPTVFAAPGLVLHPQGSLSSGPADSVLTLTTARQWFGLAVSPVGPEDAVLMEALARVLAEAWHNRNGGISSPLPPVDSPTTMGRAVTELRRLRQRAGDEAFFAGLRSFVEGRLHQSASRGDFAATMSAATGLEIERALPSVFDRAR